MEDPKQQLAQKLQAASNILVTVSANPSVDQLAACIGLTLWLNKLEKHATAVFSGSIPNALEFLQPEATIEKNTDSLRDFIIALDKSKADKLRYKVEDRVVKIFITPYRTSLSEDDLEFSQGDFNVDAIVALGVTKQQDLDNAITSHGRILHDATFATVNVSNEGELGSINWRDTTASSLSELVYDLCQMLDPKLIDPQIATALLTGIVAETERFSNKQTSPSTMNVSAALMGAGANQQLVANKLEAAEPPEGPIAKNKAGGQGKDDAASSDGILEIEHDEGKKPEPTDLEEQESEPLPEKSEADNENSESSAPSKVEEKLVIEPRASEPAFNANSVPDDLADSFSNPLNLPAVNSDEADQAEAETAGEGENQDENIIHAENPIIDPLPPAPMPLEPLREDVATPLDPLTPGADEALPVPPEPPMLAGPSVDNPQVLAPLPPPLPPPPPPILPPQPPAPPAAPSGPPTLFSSEPPASAQMPDLEQPHPAGEDQTLEDIEEKVNSPHLEDIRTQVNDALGSTEYSPDQFEVTEDENSDSKPPEVPPPIVPPNFLPPQPPPQR